MEATSNFAHALRAAHDIRKAHGLCTSDDQVVSHLLEKPLQYVDGVVVNQMSRVHRKVRRLYLRKTWDLGSFVVGIDWNSIVDWLIEHWADILKIILVIIPFFI